MEVPSGFSRFFLPKAADCGRLWWPWRLGYAVLGSWTGPRGKNHRSLETTQLSTPLPLGMVKLGNEDFQLGNTFDRWKREEVLEVLNAAKAFDGWCNIKRQQTPTALLLLGSKGGSPCRGDAWSPFVDGEISYDQRPLQQVQQRPPVERVLCQQGLPVFHITFLDCRSYGYYPATTVVTLLEDQRPSTLLRCIKRAVLNCGGGLARTP